LAVHVESTKGYVDQFAQEGLRTLLLGQRKISHSDYSQWAYLYNQAINSVLNREEEIAKVSNMVEYDLELVGSTAIEDKL
jgi:phospholipid-translocating ATPase